MDMPTPTASASSKCPTRWARDQQRPAYAVVMGQYRHAQPLRRPAASALRSGRRTQSAAMLRPKKKRSGKRRTKEQVARWKQFLRKYGPFCYMLSTGYNGFCVDPYARLRKQQGLRSGGAETVRRQRERGKAVHFRFLMGGAYPSHTSAKQFEWAMRYKRPRVVRTTAQRVSWLFELAKRPVGWKWTKKAAKLTNIVSSDKPLRIWSFDANDVLPESTATIRFDHVDSLDELAATPTA